MFDALNKFLGETAPRTINITEYLAEAQMSGYYNDTVRMDRVQINQDIKDDKDLTSFLNEKIYKFL